ncbi:MAG TPA: glycosyltransferase family 39 protein [Pyrinomonadaceae bacterium]|nr:glycosyltransferase family 39 protein [Pyrinomonadaceae bacterium]
MRAINIKQAEITGTSQKSGRRLHLSSTFGGIRRIATQHPAHLVSAALLLIMAINLLSVTARKSITIDETLIIPAGYYYLNSRTFFIEPDHPPLSKLLAGLPLVFLPLQTPELGDLTGETTDKQTLVAADRFWTTNRQHFESVFFWSRVPMVILTLLIGALIFSFARQLFNVRAAMLAVALFSFEPTILGHGRVVKDIHVAFTYLLFFFALYLYCSRPTLRRALWLGLACGLALATKYSMVILIPVLLVSFCFFELRPPRGTVRRQVLVHLLVAAFSALLILKAAFFFLNHPLIPADLETVVRSGQAHSTLLLSALKPSSAFVPPYFVYGVYRTFVHNDIGHSAFLLGNYSDHGWWYYFPVAFALKTTIPFLLITLVSLGWAAYRTIRREVNFLILLAPILIYTLMAMFAGINIGIRHLLPVFPFLFILGGAFLDRLLRARRNHRLALALTVVVIAACAMEAVRAYPNYIPYMNQFTSGRPTWQYLSDSNVEWGDDTGAVAEYLTARGETRVRASFLGGSMLLPLYGVEYVDLLSPPGISLPETRYVALGASFLNGSTVPGWSVGSGRETKEQQRNFFADYRNRTPEAVFGDSIYLYRVNK